MSRSVGSIRPDHLEAGGASIDGCQTFVKPNSAAAGRRRPGHPRSCRAGRPGPAGAGARSWGPPCVRSPRVRRSPAVSVHPSSSLSMTPSAARTNVCSAGQARAEATTEPDPALRRAFRPRPRPGSAPRPSPCRDRALPRTRRGSSADGPCRGRATARSAAAACAAASERPGSDSRSGSP